MLTSAIESRKEEEEEEQEQEEEELTDEDVPTYPPFAQVGELTRTRATDSCPVLSCPVLTVACTHANRMNSLQSHSPP